MRRAEQRRCNYNTHRLNSGDPGSAVQCGQTSVPVNELTIVHLKRKIERADRRAESTMNRQTRGETEERNPFTLEL